MKFSTATIIAFVSFTNALPAPQYGGGYGDPNSTPAVPANCEACIGNSGIPATISAPYNNSQPTQSGGGVGGGKATPKVPDASGNFGGDFGVGLDFGGLINTLLGGDFSGGINGGLDLDGFLGGLIGHLSGSGFVDGSGHINIGSVFDGLKGVLSGLPGGAELSTVCEQLKGALGGSSKIDFRALLGELQGVLSGSGKIDLGASLGIDVDVLIRGLTLLFQGSFNGSTALDIGALLDGLKGTLSAHGVFDLGANVGLDLSGSIDQLKGFLSANGSIQLDISGMLSALGGLLKGEVDLNGFIAACSKLPGGKLLFSIWGQINAYFGKLGINTSAIFGQITDLLSGLVKSAVYIAGKFLGNGHLDLSALLGALGQIGGNIGLGGNVGGNGHVGGGLNLGKWFGSLLSDHN